MKGRVTLLHAMLDIPFLLANGRILEAPFVIDTGFTGSLSLPAQDILTPGLPVYRTRRASLADNSEISLTTYRATILWNGTPRTVEVFATGGRPLLGTALLNGTELNIPFIENGEVTLEAL